MGRPSKLSPEQWAEVHRRSLSGEPARKVAADYGITEAAIRKKFGANSAISAQSSQVRTAAEKIAEANRALAELAPAQRPVAMDLGALWTRTLSSLAQAAELGADTGRRMHAIANKAAKELDLGDMESVKVVALTTRTGNEAMQPAIQLLNVRDRMNETPADPDADAAPTSGVLKVPGMSMTAVAWSAAVTGKDQPTEEKA